MGRLFSQPVEHRQKNVSYENRTKKRIKLMEQKQQQEIIGMVVAAGILVLAIFGGYKLYDRQTMPGTADAKKVLQASAEDQGGGKDVIKIVSISKLDGQASEVNGIKKYKLKIKARAKVTKSFDEWTGLHGLGSLQYVHFFKGDGMESECVIEFERSENGWNPNLDLTDEEQAWHKPRCAWREDREMVKNIRDRFFEKPISQ